MFITIQIKHSAYVTSIMLLHFHVLTIKVNALTPLVHKNRYHDYEVDAVKHFNNIDGATLSSGWLCVGVELSCSRVAPLCKCSGNFWWTAPLICRSQYLASLALWPCNIHSRSSTLILYPRTHLPSIASLTAKLFLLGARDFEMIDASIS